MIAALAWIGARARWVLLIGAFAGLAYPEGSAFLRPALPFFVAMVYALAMVRIDPIAVARSLAAPRRALGAAAAVFAMLVLSPLAGFAIVRALGLGDAYEAAVVYALAAPPIASAAAMCLIVGFSGARALELTVLSSFAMPFLGPLVAEALLGADLALSPIDLGLRMGAMVFGGMGVALIARRFLGAARIERNGRAFDGVSALGFLLFVMPLFDGVRASILASPGLAAGFLAFSALLIFGPTLVALRLPGAVERNGATGVVWGTRSVAIYLAALPPDPTFTLFVALYQFPMAGIALVFRRSVAARAARAPAAGPGNGDGP